jgi:hypothetical protein
MSAFFGRITRSGSDGSCDLRGNYDPGHTSDSLNDLASRSFPLGASASDRRRGQCHISLANG